jgi:hypothetical protein
MGKLYDFLKEQGVAGASKEIVFLIDKELTRIASLPQSEQAEAIGKISGSLIASLATLGVVARASQKVGALKRKIERADELIARRKELKNPSQRTEELQRLSAQAGQVRTRLQIVNMFLNGFGETLIGAFLAKSIGKIAIILPDRSIPSSEKIVHIDRVLEQIVHAKE